MRSCSDSSLGLVDVRDPCARFRRPTQSRIPLYKRGTGVRWHKRSRQHSSGWTGCKSALRHRPGLDWICLRAKHVSKSPPSQKGAIRRPKDPDSPASSHMEAETFLLRRPCPVVTDPGIWHQPARKTPPRIARSSAASLQRRTLSCGRRSPLQRSRISRLANFSHFALLTPKVRRMADVRFTHRLLCKLLHDGLSCRLAVQPRANETYPCLPILAPWITAPTDTNCATAVSEPFAGPVRRLSRFSLAVLPCSRSAQALRSAPTSSSVLGSPFQQRAVRSRFITAAQQCPRNSFHGDLARPVG